MSLKLKTILGVAFIEAILLALLITLTMNYLKSTNYDGLEKRAHTTVNLFASTTKDAVLSYDLASLDAFPVNCSPIRISNMCGYSLMTISYWLQREIANY